MTKHPISLIASSFNDEHIALPCTTVSGVCCVTGRLGACIPRKHLIGKSFTNHDKLAAPASDMVGVDAYQVLKYKWQRMSCWIADGHEFKRIKRQEIRDMVLSGVNAKYWCGHITTSYKKHGALIAVVNSNPFGKWVFDEKLVDCSDISKVSEWYDRLNDMIHIGAGRNILTSLIANGFVLKKIGVDKWVEFEEWAKTKYQGNLYSLLVYLLPSIEELKEEKNNEPETVKDNFPHGRQRSLF